MSEEWIPVLKKLPKCDEVVRLSRLTGRSRREVTSILIEFWSWVDSEFADGQMRGHSEDTLRTVIDDTDSSFWLAVISIGWLVKCQDGLTIPNFERHMGRNAKRRLQKNRHQRETRAEEDRMRTSDVLTDVLEMSPTKQNKTENTDPLTPRGGGEDFRQREPYTPPGETLDQLRGHPARRETLSDHPELLPAIDGVLDHYRDVCAPAPASRPQEARKVVLLLLLRGHTTATLKLAATRFAANCKLTDTKRQAAHTFYSEKGSYEEFARTPPPAAPPPPPIKRAEKLD